VLDETVRALTDDRRDQLDLSARFCAVFALAAVVLLGLLLMHGWWLAVPAGCLVLAWLACRGTVTAALAYNEALRVAFDLHRFDLLTALHLPLPESREEEKAQNDDLSAFLLQGWEADFSTSTRPRADEGTRTPDPLLTMEVLYRLSYVGAAVSLDGWSGGSRIRTCVG
jgi:hypothetical protein